MFFINLNPYLTLNKIRQIKNYVFFLKQNSKYVCIVNNRLYRSNNKSVMKNLFSKSAKLVFATTILGMMMSVVPSSLIASHIMGGEVTYQWISGNTYQVNLVLYRDCAGINVPGTMFMSYFSNSCGFLPTNFVVTSTGPATIITPACAASLPNLTCNGGTLYGVTKHSYAGTVTLPATCDDWQFYYTECCRSMNITNISGPGALSSYFSATLNNLDFPFNNSCTFTNVPTHIIANGATTSMAWGAIDVDGDSLFYELVSTRTSDTSNAIYATGFTPQQPVASSLPTTLDAASGQITVSPNLIQVSTVVIKVSEFRNGILVGEVYRDFNIATIASSNNLPELTGINGTSSFVTNVCPGDTLNFNVISSDADAAQILTLIPGAFSLAHTFTATGSPAPVGNVSI